MFYVDSREPEQIIRKVKKSGEKFEVKSLPVGDFVKGDVCIERKHIEDFVNSIQSGHLQKQLLQMEDNFKRPYLIISGDRESLKWNLHYRKWTVSHHNGALAHLTRYPKLKVFQVPNDNQLVDLVIRIMKKSFDGKVVSIMDTELLRNSVSSDDIKTRMICAIPGIGFEKAKLLRQRINILLLNEECDICKIKDIARLSGFGDSTAKKILKIHLLLPKSKQEIRKTIARSIKL